MVDKDDLDRDQIAVGKCPHCGRYPTWFNDIPLRAFCWGPKDNEHKEWSVIVPKEAYG